MPSLFHGLLFFFLSFVQVGLVLVIGGTLDRENGHIGAVCGISSVYVAFLLSHFDFFIPAAEHAF